jgi:hypothetical protein
MTFSIRLYMAIIVAVGAAPAAACLPEKDQAFAQYCVNAGDGQRTCHVSLASLSFDPSVIQGQLITASGFLVIDSGVLTIYSSRGAYQSGQRRQALQVRLPEAKQRELVRKFRARMVDFSGRIDSADVGALRRGYMGAINEPFGIAETIAPPDPDGGLESSLLIEKDDLDAVK